MKYLLILNIPYVWISIVPNNLLSDYREAVISRQRNNIVIDINEKKYNIIMNSLQFRSKTESFKGVEIIFYYKEF